MLVLVETPVFAAVGEITVPCLAGLEGGPKILVKFPVVLSGFEQAGGFAENFFRGVTRQSGEGGVDPKNDSLGVRNDNAIRGRIQRVGLFGRRRSNLWLAMQA